MKRVYYYYFIGVAHGKMIVADYLFSYALLHSVVFKTAERA